MRMISVARQAILRSLAELPDRDDQRLGGVERQGSCFSAEYLPVQTFGVVLLTI
jgi:hypothetical protein